MTVGFFEAMNYCVAPSERDSSFGTGAREVGAESDREAEAEAEVDV